ncbi:MAG TPA: YqhA family protein, partial [Burkholderiaceae bacterium]
MAFPHESSPEPKSMNALSRFIFMSRWLQMPLYLGLILAQCVYVFQFWRELIDLILAAFGNQSALQHIVTAVGVASTTAAGAPVVAPTGLNESIIMLVVLGLIDVVMISNLLIMV